MIKLETATAHIWRVYLPDFFNQAELNLLLSTEERQRAQRFKFAIHRHRFVVARAMLRKILHFYTEIEPSSIELNYGIHGKPFLKDNPLPLSFNVSHSEDWALYGLTQGIEIGIDIEKMQGEFKKEVAQRFFSESEYRALMLLSPSERRQGFYQLWVKKEAVIKALGEGLYRTLSSFSVQENFGVETLWVQQQRIQLHGFWIEALYPAAVAVCGTIQHLQHFNFKTADGSAFPKIL